MLLWIVLIFMFLWKINDFIILMERIVQLSSPQREIAFIILTIVISILILISWDKIVNGINVRKEEKKEREKPIIIDEIKNAIVPLITELKTEIFILKRRHSTQQPFNDINGYMEDMKLSFLSGEDIKKDREIAIRRMKKEGVGFCRILNFGRKIKAREKLFEIFEKERKKFEATLRPKVEAVYPPLFEQYNSMVTDEKYKITLEAKYTISSIIGNWKKLNMSNTLRFFWEEHGGELLKLRELPDVKEQIKVFDKIMDKIESHSSGMLNDLERLKNRYVDKYGILSEEINGV